MGGKVYKFQNHFDWITSIRQSILFKKMLGIFEP